MKLYPTGFSLLALVAIGFVASSGVAPAATINAANCSQSAVRAAIDSAGNGDTVTIPAGSCTWSTQVSLDATAREIRLEGSGIDKTVITAATAPVLSVRGAAGKAWTIGNMTINAGSASGEQLLGIEGTSKSWRVHHVKFNTTSNITFLIKIFGRTYGVIDHLSANGGDSGVISITGSGADVWTDTTLRWGDANAVFLEDSTVTYTTFNEGRFTIDCTNGGRYVLRYNNIKNQRTGNHGLDSGGYYSCFSVEVYNNSFSYDWPTIDGAVFLRGGSALIHDNKLTYSSRTWGSRHFRVANYRAGGGGSVGWPACNGTQYKFSNTSWANALLISTGGAYKACSANRMRLCTADPTCSASGEGTCSEFVDGTGGSGAYPCFQQVGRGTNNMLSPSYSWNNTFSGGQGEGGFSCSSGGSCKADFNEGDTTIAAGRDFYSDTPKSGYTPYTHPHPLTTGSVVAPPPAAGLTPPSNLRIVQ